MLSVMSGRLVGWDKCAVSLFRKKNGLRAHSNSDAARAHHLINGTGNVGRHLEDWRREWRGVVDDYWTLCTDVVIAKMCDPEMRGRSDQMVLYYLRHEDSKRRGRERCRGAWEKMKLDPNKVASKKAAHKIWAEKNKDYLKRKRAEWVMNNREAYRASVRKSNRRPENRIRKNLRKRLSEVLRSTSDTFASSIQCTPRQLKMYLEAQFTKRMTWENYGTYWHVDHIQPLASFDLKAPTQRSLACNWQNLRPLEAGRNMEKSDTIEVPQLHLCMAM
jgi:hypothetical protein